MACCCCILGPIENPLNNDFVFAASYSPVQVNNPIIYDIMSHLSAKPRRTHLNKCPNGFGNPNSLATVNHAVLCISNVSSINTLQTTSNK